MSSGVYDHSKIVPWNKGIKGVIRASEETKAKLREKRKGKQPGLGRKQSEEERQKRREISLRIGSKPPSHLGKICSLETRMRMSAAQKKAKSLVDQRGENGPNWRGGITPENRRGRESKAVKEWRESVMKRDNWTCQHCQLRGVTLHAHHIKSWSKHRELRTHLENGITLCKPCHHRLHGFLSRKTAQTPAT